MTYNTRLFGIPISSSPSSTTLSSAGFYAASIFQAIPGKTIDRIAFFCSASTSGVCDVRLETVSSGAPSGSLAAANTSLTGISVAANTLYDNVLTASYTVPSSASTLLAAKVLYSSGSLGVRRTAGQNAMSPRVVANTGSVTQLQLLATITVRYTDGTYHPGIPCPSVITTGSYTSASNPNEYGNKWVPSENLKVVGISYNSKLVASGSVLLRIYDDTGAVLTTDGECTVGYDSVDQTSVGLVADFLFANPVYLTAGRAYYISALANASTTNNCQQSRFSFGNQALHDAIYPGITGVTRNGGAWTETATDVSAISPIIDSAYSLKYPQFGQGL